MVSRELSDWLRSSPEPWTRYRTRLDLLDQDPASSEVLQDREALVRHPDVQGLVEKSASWPGYALKRHNDAKHPLHSLSVLADYGLRQSDPGMERVVEQILSHQSEAGPFQTLIQLYKMFGGLEGEYWTWMSCDAPLLLYVLLSLGLGDRRQVLEAAEFMAGLVQDNGWRCHSDPLLGKFKGPGKGQDPCPIANLLALKALALIPADLADPVAERGIEMLLDHWDLRGEKKYFLFGIGTDFRKIKYPLIWYDILHVLDVLSQFPAARQDPRYRQMLEALIQQGDQSGRYTAGSIYQAWKGWSFADKKNPSPWLTFLVARILKRSDA